MAAENARCYSKFGDVCSNSERFLLLLSLGKNHETDNGDLKTFQQKIATKISSQSNKAEHNFIPHRKCYIAVADQSSCLKHRDQSVDADWLLLNHLDRGSTNKKSSRRSSSRGDTSIGDDEVFENQEVNTNELDAAMAEFIHALSDKLPRTGHYLDILWLASPNTDVSISDHITLYGALQRLCSWHEGVLTMVLDDTTVDRPKDSALHTWLNHLHGRVVGLDSVDEVVMGDMAWRGDVLVADGKGQKSVCLPGFTLSPLLGEKSKVAIEYVEETTGSTSPKSKLTKPHQTKKIVAFSRQLQVVCSVKRADVPCMYLSPTTLSLNLLPGSRLPRSQHYLEWLSTMGQSNDTAVIMRLPCRTLTPRTSSQHAKPLSTKEWKEHIRNNSGDLSVPDLNMQETQEFFYLLVHGGDVGKDVVTAHVMNSPHDLTGVVHAKLAEYQDLLPFDDCENARATLSTIPNLDGAQLQSLLEEVELIQAEALKKYIEDRKSEGREPAITFAELRLLMGTVYSTFMATREELSATNEEQDDVDADNLRSENLFSELDVPPSSWMERLALQNHEAIEKKIKRFKSGEMMLAGLPVPAPADNTIKLSAEEFLKHFLASGLPSTEDLCPVGVGAANRPSGLTASRHVCSSNLDWDQLKKATFQEAQKFTSSPGILYCLDSRKSQQVDRHFSKMQQRYIRYETASTCSSEQAASPATLTIPSAAAANPTSATKKGKVHLRLNSRGQRSAEKGQRSAEKQRRLVLEKGHKISPGRLHGRGLKRQRPEMASVLAAKRRIMPTRTSPRKNITELPTKTSPRKKLTAEGTSEGQPLSEKKIEETSTSSSSSNVRKVSRSDRTRMKLRQIVKETVIGRGITKESECYKACIERLYKMAELYVKDLKTSKGLDEEMKKIAEANVDFAVQFERTRIQNS